MKSNSELVMTLIASESDMSKEGHSALIMKLPAKDDLTPIFSEPYYIANYVVAGNEAKVVFSNPISIANKKDITDISISVDSKYYILLS